MPIIGSQILEIARQRFSDDLRKEQESVSKLIETNDNEAQFKIQIRELVSFVKQEYKCWKCDLTGGPRNLIFRISKNGTFYVYCKVLVKENTYISVPSKLMAANKRSFIEVAIIQDILSLFIQPEKYLAVHRDKKHLLNFPQLKSVYFVDEAHKKLRISDDEAKFIKKFVDEKQRQRSLPRVLQDEKAATAANTTAETLAAATSNQDSDSEMTHSLNDSLNDHPDIQDVQDVHQAASHPAQALHEVREVQSREAPEAQMARLHEKRVNAIKSIAWMQYEPVITTIFPQNIDVQDLATIPAVYILHQPNDSKVALIMFDSGSDQIKTFTQFGNFDLAMACVRFNGM